jgi:steroid delta-isomerase-like uncharacterized protein
MASTISDYFAALNNLDREAYVACFSADALLRDPYGGQTLQGIAGLQQFFQGMERTWAYFQMTPVAHYPAGDRVAVPWQAKATAKSGKTAEFAGVNIFTLAEDGKIKQLDGYWDFKAMVAQIS